MRAHIAIALSSVLALSACASGYQKFYKPYVDPKTLHDVQLLAPGETPKIFSTSDMQRDVKIARAKNFIPIGFSSFNGELEGEQGVVNQAKEVGAVMVLTTSKFSETRTVTTPLFLPNSQTTYGSGTVNGAYGSANYAGTSTTYGTTVVPITSQQQRYEQAAVYFVKLTRKLRFGLFLNDLTPETRAKLERNTGALIDIVGEESPSFAANILPGDILIDIGGRQVLNARQGLEVMNTFPSGAQTVPLTIIRNGQERVISVALTF